MQPQFADPRDVARIVRDMDADMLTCRDFGHHWKTRHINRYRDYFERILACQVCGTEAIQRLARNGAVLDRRYTYADGYLMKGMGRLDSIGKGAIRLAIFDSMSTEGMVIDMEKKKRERKKAS